jgi:hypothetical protein
MFSHCWVNPDVGRPNQLKKHLDGRWSLTPSPDNQKKPAHTLALAVPLLCHDDAIWPLPTCYYDSQQRWKVRNVEFLPVLVRTYNTVLSFALLFLFL